MDDASTDDSINIIKEILKKYPSRVSQCKFIYNKENLGVSSSRNKVLMVTSGEFICFCDNDDWMDKDMLLSMYHYAKSNKSDLVLCDAISVDCNGEEILHIQYPILIKSMHSGLI